MYIDNGRKGGPSTLEDFTARTGIAVDYSEDINDNREFLAKIRPDLEAGRDCGRDLFVVDEEPAYELIRNGWVAPLDRANLSNAGNLLPRLAAPAFDPGRAYTMPWQSGFTGIGWNAPLLRRELGVDALTSLDEFFDPRLAGRVVILAEPRDTLGVLMPWLGIEPENFTRDEFMRAVEVLQGYVDSGHIRQATGNDYLSSLETGDAIAAIGWSGDILALGSEFGFALPESGGMYWADALVIPRGAAGKAAAERLIDWYYDPVIAARLAAYIQYASPVTGAQEAMRTIAPRLADDPWIFPPSEVLEEAHSFMAIEPEDWVSYERAFMAAIGA